MSEEYDKIGSITEITKAVVELADKVPVYQDAIQPAAKEIGKGLQVVAKAVNAALIPVEGFIWGVERIRDFVRESVGRRLENVPPEDIQPPNAHIGVPAIDALRYTGAENELSELYANLLATSMDRITAYKAHPGFVDIIKNMCPDEARIMKFLALTPDYPLINIKSVSTKNTSFKIIHRHQSLLGIDAEVEHPPLTSTYIDNLQRLGLIQVENWAWLTNDTLYTRIQESPLVRQILADLNNIKDCRSEVEKIRLVVTDLGIQFIRACVVDKEKQPRN